MLVEMQNCAATMENSLVAALFTIAKRWKQLKCSSTDEWIYKMWCIHTRKCYLATQRNEALIHAARINLENIMINERSQTENAIYCMIPFICVQNRQIYRIRK